MSVAWGEISRHKNWECGRWLLPISGITCTWPSSCSIPRVKGRRAITHSLAADRNNMLKRINLAAILVLVCALTASAFQNADWIKVAPVGAGFSVLMPGKPEEEVKSAPDFTFHLFSIIAEKTIYIAGYGDYPPTIKLAPDGELAANRDNFLKR